MKRERRFIAFFGLDPFETTSTTYKSARWAIGGDVKKAYGFECSIELLLPYIHPKVLPEPQKGAKSGEKLAEEIKKSPLYREAYQR